MDFYLIEILIVILLSIFQSVFGIGLLLYGTPLFLLLGNDFFYSLNILLPISMTISFLQIRNRKVSFKIDFLKLFNFITLPTLILTLLILIFNYKNINIILIVAFVIIFFSLINIFFKKKLSILFKNNVVKKLVFVSIGLVHGLTNLGGSLLAITSTQMNTSKEITRYCVAYGYLIMGGIQLIVIFLFSDNQFVFSRLYMILIPILIYKPSQKVFFKFSHIEFSSILNVIALLFGLYLLIKLNL